MCVLFCIYFTPPKDIIIEENTLDYFNYSPDFSFQPFPFVPE